MGQHDDNKRMVQKFNSLEGGVTHDGKCNTFLKHQNNDRCLPETNQSINSGFLSVPQMWHKDEIMGYPVKTELTFQW